MSDPLPQAGGGADYRRTALLPVVFPGDVAPKLVNNHARTVCKPFCLPDFLVPMLVLVGVLVWVRVEDQELVRAHPAIFSRSTSTMV